MEKRYFLFNGEISGLTIPGCCKIMLLSGSKDEKTLQFYNKAGYNSTDKTAFVQWTNR